jgi:hypothetical protein
MLFVPTVADPVMVTLHPGKPEMLPAGTVIVNDKVEPVNAPENVPLNTTVPSEVDETIVPEMLEPV